MLLSRIIPIMMSYEETAPEEPIVNDTFDRANSTTTLGSPWVIYGTAVYGINNNQAYQVSGSGSFQYAAITSPSADVTMELDFPIIGAAGENPRVYFRGTDATNMWGFVPFDTSNSGSAWTLYKYEAGVALNMQGTITRLTDITRTDGDNLRVVCNGSNHKCYVNDTLVYDFNHAFNNGGTLFGFSGQNSLNFRADNFILR